MCVTIQIIVTERAVLWLCACGSIVRAAPDPKSDLFPSVRPCSRLPDTHPTAVAWSLPSESVALEHLNRNDEKKYENRGYFG